MEAGKLRHRLIIQRPPVVPVRDSTGAEVETWEPVSAVWGRVEPLSGRELYAARQFNAEVSHRVTMRFAEGIIPTMRVLFGSRAFDVHAVLNPDERNRELQLACSEFVQRAAAV